MFPREIISLQRSNVSFWKRVEFPHCSILKSLSMVLNFYVIYPPVRFSQWHLNNIEVCIPKFLKYYIFHSKSNMFFCYMINFESEQQCSMYLILPHILVSLTIYMYLYVQLRTCIQNRHTHTQKASRLLFVFVYHA